MNVIDPLGLASGCADKTKGDDGLRACSDGVPTGSPCVLWNGGCIPADVAALFAPNESANAYVDPTGGLFGPGGEWIPDSGGAGGFYNPLTQCYTNRDKIFCNPIGFAETFASVAL